MPLFTVGLRVEGEGGTTFVGTADALTPAAAAEAVAAHCREEWGLEDDTPLYVLFGAEGRVVFHHWDDRVTCLELSGTEPTTLDAYIAEHGSDAAHLHRLVEDTQKHWVPIPLPGDLSADMRLAIMGLPWRGVRLAGKGGIMHLAVNTNALLACQNTLEELFDPDDWEDTGIDWSSVWDIALPPELEVLKRMDSNAFYTA